MGGELETRSAGRRIIETCMGYQKIDGRLDCRRYRVLAGASCRMYYVH